MIYTSKLSLFYSARGRKEAQGHNIIQVCLPEYGCEIIFRRRRNVLLAVSLPFIDFPTREMNPRYLPTFLFPNEIFHTFQFPLISSTSTAHLQPTMCLLSTLFIFPDLCHLLPWYSVALCFFYSSFGSYTSTSTSTSNVLYSHQHKTSFLPTTNYPCTQSNSNAPSSKISDPLPRQSV